MLEQLSNPLSFYAMYIASKTGASGLTDVTCDVYRNSASILLAASACPIGGGLYYYTLTSASNSVEGEYIAIFKTADATVDQRHIPALWVSNKAGVENLNATIDSRSTYAGADTAGTATLLARVIGTVAAGTHQPQTGDSYAVVTNATYGNNALHTDITSIGIIAGAGSETVTITCNDGTNPLEGVAVWVTTDIAGTNIVAGTLYSSALGIVTVYLDPGTYQVFKQGGANWTNPTQIVVTDV